MKKKTKKQKHVFNLKLHKNGQNFLSYSALNLLRMFWKTGKLKRKIIHFPFILDINKWEIIHSAQG